MTADRLKVRCYQCNQLLAVAPTKAGSIVACPKCKAELLIPGAEPEAKRAEGDVGIELGTGAGAPTEPFASKASPSQRGRSSSPAIPSFMEEIAAAIPADIAALRPEDLRVEAEFFGNLTREPPSTGPEPISFPFAPAPSPAPEPSPTPKPADAPIPWPPSVSPPVAAEPVDVIPTSQASPPPLPESRALVPPIEIEPPTILPPGAVVRRVREVTLPASVVLAWSLFVLLGIAMSFIAGLLIGHYLWRILP